MGTKWIENTGTNAMFVGGKMIPAGEGRLIEESFLPPERRDQAEPLVQQPEAPGLDDLVRALLKKSVREVTAELAGLTQEALDRAQALEAEDKTPRSTLLAAMSAEQLKRADDRLFQERVDLAYQQQLEGLTAEELQAIGEEGLARLREQAELDVKAAG